MYQNWKDKQYQWHLSIPFKKLNEKYKQLQRKQETVKEQVKAVNVKMDPLIEQKQILMNKELEQQENLNVLKEEQTFKDEQGRFQTFQKLVDDIQYNRESIEQGNIENILIKRRKNIIKVNKS